MKTHWKRLNGEFIDDFQLTLEKDIENITKNNWDIEVIVGTDSQIRKFKRKKKRFITYISALVLRRLTPGQKWNTHFERQKRIGNGGLCFYIKLSEPLNYISIEQRLINETQKSLELADYIDNLIVNYNLCIYDIHLDLNGDKKHLSNKVVNQCAGWVKGVGYIPVLKPNSWVASKVADRLTRK